MNNLSFGIVLLALNALAASADWSPVLVKFGNGNSLKKVTTVGEGVSSDDFLEMIDKNLDKNDKIEIITVDPAHLVDFGLVVSQTKGELEDSNYLYLVSNPLDTINEFLESNDLSAEITHVSSSVEALLLMDKIEQNSDKSTIIITSSASKVRVRRQDAGTDQTKGSVYDVFGQSCAASFDAVYILNMTKTIGGFETVLSVDKNNLEFKCDSNKAKLVIRFDNFTEGENIKEISMDFNLTNRYWHLVGGQVLSDLQNSNQTYILAYYGTPYGMETPVGFSFVCTKTYFQLINTDQKQTLAKVSLYIDRLQFQAFGMNEMTRKDNSTVYIYGPFNYCQGFFSSGIWMAITSSLLLVFILSCGVTMLFNIKTMDRFDDPKGKPLNIAQEK